MPTSRSELLRFRRRVGVGALALLVAGCGGEPAAVAVEASHVGRSPDGMVASAHPMATDAGVAMLEMGGNAVDAAVATAFALAVVEPSMSGLGGRAQMIIWFPDGTMEGVDGTTQTPAAYREPAAGAEGDEGGYASVATPGAVAALVDAQARFGALDLPTVMDPAVRLARDGFLLHAGEAERMARAAEGLAGFEGSRRHFLKEDGSPYQAGERFVQSDLARTLRLIADGGAAVFYTGAIAERIAEDMAEHGGLVTLEDLAAYQVRDLPIARGQYRGHEIVGAFLPASGGAVIQTLQTLESFDFQGRAGSPEWAAVVAHAFLLAVRDRASQWGPLDEMAARVTSPEWARARAEEVRARLPGIAGAGADPGDGAGASAEEMTAVDNTTHLSVADGSGMAVALTQSLGPNFGSQAATSGLGFLYGATLGRALPPASTGLRGPVLNQSPVMVLRDGRPVYILGAAGGARIPSAVVSVLSRVLDQGLSLEEAVAAPRIHPRAPDRLELEDSPVARWSGAEWEALRSLGMNPETMGDHARVHGIQVLAGSGAYVGVADPRREGSARGPARR